MLDDGISEKLVALAGSSRKQGEFLSNLIRASWDNRQAMKEGVDVESLRYQMLGLAGEHKAIESRVLQLERTVAALIADKSQ
jgi:hypothetical protein